MARNAADAVRPWVDIDKAAVDFTLGGAIGQHRHGFGKGSVDQHRAIDQRDILSRPVLGMGGKSAGQKGGATGPILAAFGNKPVDFGRLQDRESPRKTGGGACGKDQFGNGREYPIGQGRGGGVKADGDPVLAFLGHWRTVKPQHFLMAFEIGGRHKQIERVAGRKQRCGGWAVGHRIQRLGQQA